MAHWRNTSKSPAKLKHPGFRGHILGLPWEYLSAKINKRPHVLDVLSVDGFLGIPTWISLENMLFLEPVKHQIKTHQLLFDYSKTADFAVEELLVNSEGHRRSLPSVGLCWETPAAKAFETPRLRKPWGSWKVASPGFFPSAFWRIKTHENYHDWLEKPSMNEDVYLLLES